MKTYWHRNEANGHQSCCVAGSLRSSTLHQQGMAVKPCIFPRSLKQGLGLFGLLGFLAMRLITVRYPVPSSATTGWPLHSQSCPSFRSAGCHRDGRSTSLRSMEATETEAYPQKRKNLHNICTTFWNPFERMCTESSPFWIHLEGRAAFGVFPSLAVWAGCQLPSSMWNQGL